MMFNLNDGRDVEALMAQVEAERLEREENERLDDWLNNLEAEPLSEEEIAKIVQRIFREDIP